MKLKLSRFFLLLLSSITLYAQDDDLFSGSLEELMQVESEIKTDVGSRNTSRDFLDSLSPVDVVTHQQIRNSGLTSLTDILRYFVAGFNAPETSIADGSDHVRVFTLRGMSPDQVLVLINGKRLHSSSLLHVNGTIGRGSSGVDLDTIAPLSIERVEILRDGAAAQYGSDAIAGVINIILKGSGYKNEVILRASTRAEGDGESLVADAFLTTQLKYDGFVNLTLQAKKQNSTSRGGLDQRLSPPRISSQVGVPESQNFLAVLNAEIPQEGTINIYTNAIFNYRDSEASTFFRPSSPENIAIYPNGFLPMLNAKILDYSFALGVKGLFPDGSSWDLSNVYGVNQINYYLNNSMNHSLGASSPTSFSNGGLEFIQNTSNLDLKKSYENLNVAGGLEFRVDSYKIKAGETASYTLGSHSTTAGSQGFPGHQSQNEVDTSRHSYAGYLDLTYNFSSDFTIELASRYENFSDFGSTSNVKLASSYKIVPSLLLRSSISNAFRAPLFSTVTLL